MAGAGRIAVLLLALVLWAGTALAFDEGAVAIAERNANFYRAGLEAVTQDLQLPSLTDERLAAHRDSVEDIRTKALSDLATLADPLSEVDQQIALLGPVPADGGAEATAVAEQRAGLEAVKKRLQSVKSQLELAAVTAEQLGSRISTHQRGLFLKRIFERDRSILNPTLWQDTWTGFSLMAWRLAALYSAWWKNVGATADFRGLALIPVFLAASLSVYLLIRGRIRRWIDTNLAAKRAPGDFDRLWRVARAVAASLAILLVLTTPVSLALDIAGFMTTRFALVYEAGLDVLYSTVIYWVLARRITAPGQPAWRLVDLDDGAAARIAALGGLAALASSVFQALGTVADGLGVRVAYTAGQSALAATALLILLALILLTIARQPGLPGRSPARRVYFKWLRVLSPLIWLLLGVGAIGLLAGYVALARYISQTLFETTVLIIVLFLLHHLCDAAIASSLDGEGGFGRFLRRFSGLGERGILRVGLLIRIAADVLLVVAGLPLLFLLWTVTWIDFRGLANSVLIGFRLGDITFSPSLLAAVILVLVAGIVLTNLLVRWLDRRILSETRIDKGVQDSVRKGASYTGYAIAAGVAFTAAGFDLSSIALIAGALGVGIGFGLQAIVNNFVSGLVLLIERPVRVGDWVALPAGEGIIKRINVRATEIETFDNCTVIVPNSVLVTGAVSNWTHDNSLGRFSVAVSVPYGSDETQAAKLLIEAARSHPKVVTHPGPQVQLVRFGNLGLDFEIKAAVADIFDGAQVASDIRFALLKAFAENGIAIAHAPSQPEQKS
jgi:small-conductance mechanosensitive channel